MYYDSAACSASGSLECCVSPKAASVHCPLSHDSLTPPLCVEAVALRGEGSQELLSGEEGGGVGIAVVARGHAAAARMQEFAEQVEGQLYGIYRDDKNRIMDSCNPCVRTTQGPVMRPGGTSRNQPRSESGNPIDHLVKHKVRPVSKDADASGLGAAAAVLSGRRRGGGCPRSGTCGGAGPRRSALERVPARFTGVDGLAGTRPRQEGAALHHLREDGPAAPQVDPGAVVRRSKQDVR
eukprot:gene13288-biopygen6108